MLDSKEMVEIRHGLVDRRQKLRTQMEYNKGLVTAGQKEIKDTIENYPQYKDEILEINCRFCDKKQYYNRDDIEAMF